MYSVGINGFGRIGKCVFMLLLENRSIAVSVINAPDFDVHKIKSYLLHDSIHKYHLPMDIEILDDYNFKINGNVVTVVKTRNAKEIRWKEDFNVDTVIDATGAYLTKEKHYNTMLVK